MEKQKEYHSYHLIDSVHEAENVENNYDHILLTLEKKFVDYQNDDNIKYHQEIIIINVKKRTNQY